MRKAIAAVDPTMALEHPMTQQEQFDIEGTDEVSTIPNSLGVCDEWWLFRLLNCAIFRQG